MGSYINKVAEEIKKLVDQYAKLYPTNSSLHIGFVGYRDFNDSKRFETLGFTDDVSAFKSFVSGVKADGGGDAAEDVAGGLDKATGLDWDVGRDGSTRILVHIADAPAHGNQYNGGCGDDWAEKPTPDGSDKSCTKSLKCLKAL